MHYIPQPPQRATEWYVVHCRPHQELQVASIVEDRMALTVYLPEIKRRFRGQIQYVPLFPCYLFVRVDLQIVSLSRINTTPGVVRLIAFSEVPQTVPDDLIEELRERVKHLNARGGLLNHCFRPGDTLRLKDGPFRGLDAVFQGPMKPSARVRILIEFLGRPRQIDVFVDALESAQLAPPFHIERRTRGRGRVIKSGLASVTDAFSDDARAAS